MLRSILAIGLLLLNQAQAREVFMATVSHVTDGDTLWVRPNDGGSARKLRIEGIDAPEICQRGGEASRATLTQLVSQRSVEVVVSRMDDFGRGLARIRLEGRDLGALMVEAGQAWSYRWRQHPGPYVAEEARARQARRGLFEVEQAERPGDFRKRHSSCYLPPDGR